MQLRHGSISRAPAYQVVGSEFTLQYHQKKKREREREREWENKNHVKIN
jgi:hypothetical protein